MEPSVNRSSPGDLDGLPPAMAALDHTFQVSWDPSQLGNNHTADVKIPAETLLNALKHEHMGDPAFNNVQYDLSHAVVYQMKVANHHNTVLGSAAVITCPQLQSCISHTDVTSGLRGITLARDPSPSLTGIKYFKKKSLLQDEVLTKVGPIVMTQLMDEGIRHPRAANVKIYPRESKMARMLVSLARSGKNFCPEVNDMSATQTVLELNDAACQAAVSYVLKDSNSRFHETVDLSDGLTLTAQRRDSRPFESVEGTHVAQLDPHTQVFETGVSRTLNVGLRLGLMVPVRRNLAGPAAAGAPPAGVPAGTPAPSNQWRASYPHM